MIYSTTLKFRLITSPTCNCLLETLAISCYIYAANILHFEGIKTIHKLQAVAEQNIPFHEQSIDFLKGIGPIKGDILRKELGVYTMEDLLLEFPFRYVDKTTINLIKDIHTDGQVVQLKGVLSDHRMYRLLISNNPRSFLCFTQL